MQAQCSQETISGMAPSQSESGHTWASNILYQAATVLAILLFLVSF